MKIVYLFRSMAIVGGVEKILIEKMNYLSALPGYEITLITYEQGSHPMAFPLSSAVKHLDLNILFYTRYKYVSDFHNSISCVAGWGAVPNSLIVSW